MRNSRRGDYGAKFSPERRKEIDYFLQFELKLYCWMIKNQYVFFSHDVLFNVSVIFEQNEHEWYV